MSQLSDRIVNALAAAGAFSFAYDLLHPPLGKFDIVLLTVLMFTTGVYYALKAVAGSKAL